MRATRRTVLKAAAAAPVLGATAFPSRADAAVPLRPQGTTLDSTVLRGPAVNAQGYVRVVSGPGEPHLLREDLGTKARAGRAGRRRPLLALAHLTDIHVIDAQSPARVEYTDRYDDDPQTALIFSAAYRPQEMLTTQVADAIVQAVEDVRVGPVSGRRLDFAICTGDNNDNCQRNELRWQIDVLDGTRFTPDSGDPARTESVADASPDDYDIHYWHPDGTPPGAGPLAADDNARRLYGFPTVPGLLDASRRAFTPKGLSIPWYTCFGNHDGLVQGNFPVSIQLGQIAVGPLKVTSLPAGVSIDDLRKGDPAAAAALAAAPARQVTPDPMRAVISRTESVKEHFTTGGLPLGHGYTAANVAAGTAHYVFDPHPSVRGIVMDTCNPNGYADGSLDAEQFAWLQAELARAESERKVALLFSHHTSQSLENPITFVDDPQLRVLGAQILDALLVAPALVLWVDGHTHRNEVRAHLRPGGGGFWEISTASHVDWPAQARVLELLDNRDGTLSVFGTIVDAAAPLAYAGRLDSPQALASLARELAANDWQGRGDGRRGAVEDRNVELVVAAPFALSTTPTAPARPDTVVADIPGLLPATGGRDALAAAGAAALAAGLALRARRPDPAPDA